MSLPQGPVAGALGQGATTQSQDTCHTSCVGAAAQPNGSVPRPAAPRHPRPGASGQRRPLRCTAEATAVQVRRRAHERWSAPQRGAHECRARCMLRELSHAHDGGRSGAVSAVPCRCPAAQAVTRTGSAPLAAQLAFATAVLRVPRSMAARAHDGGRSGAVSAVPCRRPAAQAVTRTGSGSLAAQLASATAVLRCRARWRLARRKAAAWCGNSRGPHCLGRSAAPPQPRFQLSAFRRANDGSHILYFCRADAPYRHRTAA